MSTPTVDLADYTAEQLENLRSLMTLEEQAEFDLLLMPSLEAIEADWRLWLRTLFPQFVRGELAPYHIEYWDWLWGNLMAKRRGEPVPDGNAFLAIWGRGCAKTTFARLAPIAEAAILGEGYCLYVSMTQSQANSHLASIKEYLEGSPKFPNDRLRFYYPQICKPRVSSVDKGSAGSRTWNQQMMRLASGYVVQAVGLDAGVRGANISDMRVSLLVPDDIDTRSDTVLQSEQKMDTFLHSVLPTKRPGTIFICAQNLVIEHGCINRIVTGEVPAFATARFSGPHPRVLDLRTETQEYKGRQRTVILSGTPSWPAQTLDEIQSDIDDYTWPVFVRECQHQLAVDRTGLVLSPWDDLIHVITQSQFKALFGYDLPPSRWSKEVLHDWAVTKSAFHANVMFKLAVSAQNEPLPGCIFLYDAMSFDANTEADDVAIRLLMSIAPTVNVRGVEMDWGQVLRAEFERYNLEQFVSSATALMKARRDVLAKIIPPLVGPLLRRHKYRRLRMSHEAKDQRNIYRMVYGLPFTGVNPRREGGIEFARHYLRVDPTREHPFKKGVMGWSQMYVIVPDEKEGYPIALRPDALNDSDLMRYQFSHWRHSEPHLTSTGVIEHGPEKMNDDFGNALQMGMLNGGLVAEPLTYEEKIEELIPAPTRLDSIKQPSMSLTGRTTMSPRDQMAYELARQFAQQQLGSQHQQFDEYGDAVD